MGRTEEETTRRNSSQLCNERHNFAIINSHLCNPMFVIASTRMMLLLTIRNYQKMSAELSYI